MSATADSVGPPDAAASGRTIGVAGAMALVGGALVASVLLHWPSLGPLVRIWAESRTYQHGWPLLAACVWLALRNRAALDPAAFAPSLPALPLLVACGAAWTVLQLADVQLAAQLLIPVTAWLTVLVAFGRPAARAMWLPVATMCFALPAWELVRPALQALTIALVSRAASALDIAHFVDGTLIVLPRGALSVEEECSGLNFLLVAVSLGLVLTGTSRGSALRKSAVLAAAAGVALLANWTRVLVLVVLTSRHGPGHPLVTDHYLAGMLLFAAFLAAYFLLAVRCLEPAARPMAPPPGRLQLSSLVALGGALLLGSALPLLWQVWRSDPPPVGLLAVPAYAAPPGFARLEATEGGWWPSISGAAAARRTEYTGRGVRVRRFEAVYGNERQGFELVSVHNRIQGPEGWRRSPYERADSQGSFGVLVAHAPDGARWLIGFRYAIGNHRAVSGAAAKLWLGFDRARGSVSASRIVAVGIPCSASCSEEHAIMKHWFVSEAVGR